MCVTTESKANTCTLLNTRRFAMVHSFSKWLYSSDVTSVFYTHKWAKILIALALWSRYLLIWIQSLFSVVIYCYLIVSYTYVTLKIICGTIFLVHPLLRGNDTVLVHSYLTMPMHMLCSDMKFATSVDKSQFLIDDSRIRCVRLVYLQ
jgi:hypothetical protein